MHNRKEVLQAKINIINTLRNAINSEEAKRYNKFTRRVIDMFRRYLPDYTFTDKPESFSEKDSYGFMLWGKSISYSEYISVYWNKDKDWKAALLHELARYNFEQELHKLEIEEKYAYQFEVLNNQVELLKRKAKDLYNSNFPSSAHYELPSYEYVEKFPALFK